MHDIESGVNEWGAAAAERVTSTSPRVTLTLTCSLRLAVAGEVDDVGRGVDRREELRDAHAQVAVHPVGDHLRGLGLGVGVGVGACVSSRSLIFEPSGGV